jgi:hypothetical protein
MCNLSFARFNVCYTQEKGKGKGKGNGEGKWNILLTVDYYNLWYHVGLSQPMVPWVVLGSEYKTYTGFFLFSFIFFP